MPTICVCVNCGHQSGTKPGDAECPLYCKDCKTPELRQKMADAQRELQKENAAQKN